MCQSYTCILGICQVVQSISAQGLESLGEKFIENALKNYNNENIPALSFQRNACTHIDGMRQFMASPQCMGYNGGGVTDKICFPADEDVLQ